MVRLYHWQVSRLGFTCLQGPCFRALWQKDTIGSWILSFCGLSNSNSHGTEPSDYLGMSVFWRCVRLCAISNCWRCSGRYLGSCEPWGGSMLLLRYIFMKDNRFYKEIS